MKISIIVLKKWFVEIGGGIMKKEFKKKVTIIVPIYNAEKYLKECIESLLNQTLKEIEIILINDGSTDNSRLIIDNYKNVENVKIIHKSNEGVSKTRNLGLSLATGEYILNVDSDDFIDSKMCEELYKNAKENNSDIVISDIYSYIDNQNKKYVTDLKIEGKISAEKYLEIFLEKNFFGYNWNKLIKRELFIKNKIKYNPEISMMEDTLVLVQLVKNSNTISKVNKAYYYYRKTETAVSQNVKFKHVKSVMEISKRVKKELEFKRNLKEVVNKRFVCSLTQFIFNCEEIKREDKKQFHNILTEYLGLFKEKYSKDKLANKKIEFIISLIEKLPLKVTIIVLRKIKLEIEGLKRRRKDVI